MKVILHPYSTKLHSGNPNPKAPSVWYWSTVVHKLNALGYEVIQIGIPGETKVEGVSQWIINWPLKKLRTLMEDADCFVTVDSFLPHFVYAEKLNKRGVVLFSLSDPEIWGHPTNINLLKSREFLRPLQYQSWTFPTYNEDAFVTPDEVISAVQNLVAPVESADRGFAIPAGFRLEKQAS